MTGATTDHRRAIADAVRAVRIVAPASHTWFGAPSAPLAPELERHLTPETARELLVYELQNRLYADMYCAGGARPSLPPPGAAPLPGHSPFVEALSRANAGSGGREPGWTLVGEQDGALVVARDGLHLWTHPDEVYTGDGAPPARGAAVGVLMPNELLRLSPGFYMALGDEEFPADGSLPLVRFYWNLRADGAAALVGALTVALNRRRIAFRLKVASDPVLYGRCDAGVLYVPTADYDRVASVVAGVHRTLAAGLRSATPALTKGLAPGLGLAEDPPDPTVSFGMSRCALLAAGIVDAADRGADEAAALQLVEQRFAAVGISLDAPYLNPGSVDRYAYAPS